MTDTPEPEFDAQTRLRMWCTTQALAQRQNSNTSFEGAIKNADALYNFISGKGAPLESSIKVVKTLDAAR